MANKVVQTRFGYPEGNCLMACVASILEVPLEELPDLHEECDTWNEEEEKWVWEGDWWGVLSEAVKARGWKALGVKEGHLAPWGFAIAGGDSPRADVVDEEGKNVGHVIVCLDGKPWHDPHPSGAGLGGPIQDWILLIPPMAKEEEA